MNLYRASNVCLSNLCRKPTNIYRTKIAQPMNIYLKALRIPPMPIEHLSIVQRIPIGDRSEFQRSPLEPSNSYRTSNEPPTEDIPIEDVSYTYRTSIEHLYNNDRSFYESLAASYRASKEHVAKNHGNLTKIDRPHSIIYRVHPANMYRESI